MAMTPDDDPGIASTGCPGLDNILRGGLPAGQLYLLEGSSGAGKTTLGLQFLLEGVRRGERVLWCTLAETESQLVATARSHQWDLSGIQVVNLAELDNAAPSDDYSFFSPSDVELNSVVNRIFDTVDRLQPRRIVFDPFSDVKLLARDPLRFRRQLLRLREHFARLGSTVLLIQEAGVEMGNDTAGEGVVHGIISLYQHAPDYGKQRRRLRVHKMRGVAYREGFHDIAIQTGGVVVFPRLVANEHDVAPVKDGVVPSGLEALDAMLGGGLDRGGSMLVIGPSGVGKSTLCMHLADHVAARGARAAIYMFDETRRAFLARADALGMSTRSNLEAGRVAIRQVDPAEFSPGEFSHLIRRAVEDDGTEMVVIDSLNGYLTAMPDEKHLAMHMHELLSYLANRNVVTLLTLNQQGVSGEPSDTPVDVTYLTDAAVLMRYRDEAGDVSRSISVVKRRVGPHESCARRMAIEPPGIAIGAQIGVAEGSASPRAGDPTHGG